MVEAFAHKPKEYNWYRRLCNLQDRVRNGKMAGHRYRNNWLLDNMDPLNMRHVRKIVRHP